MIRHDRKARRTARWLGLTAILFGLTAAPAAAAPSFGVQLSRQASEVQLVNVRASGGTFRLEFGAGGPGVSETADLDAGVLADPGGNVDVQAEVVRNALNGLANINVGGGSVSVESKRQGFFAVTFDGGPLANSDVPQLRSVAGSTPLSGGIEKVTTQTAYPSGVSRSDKRLDYALEVKNTGADPTAGTATAEIMLPAGAQSSVLAAGGGWACTAQAPVGIQPARADCTSSQVVAPGAFYDTLTISDVLGADAPAHAVATATLAGAGAAGSTSGSDEFDFAPAKPFGVEYFDTEVNDLQGGIYTQAGGHPFAASLDVAPNTARNAQFGVFESVEAPKSIITDLPRGFVGNALSVPALCPSLTDVIASLCPPASAVGTLSVDINLGATPVISLPLVIYAIEPEFGAPAQFGFAEPTTLNSTYTLTPRLRADDGYAISLDATPSAIFPAIRRINYATLCSFGAKLSTGSPAEFESCKRATDPTANPVPLVTNPTRCTGAPPTSRMLIDSWQHPGDFKSAESANPLPTGCEKVPFQPQIELSPTSTQADSPTGMDVEVTMPTDGLKSPTGVSQANLDNATVTFPKGMSVNPASAHGLDACTLAQVKLGSNAADECPLSSRVGTVEVETPLIREPLTGYVYLAAQNDNPFKSTLGIYMVFSSAKDGITIKVAGKLAPDPVTGQLTSIFTENPEAPFSRLALHFNSGPRAPLINPPKCGSYAIHSELSPWSAANPANPTAAEIVAADSTYDVTAGPGGGSCPSGSLEPHLKAGLTNPTAGAKSPFVLRLNRDDGSQRFTALDVSMPKGLTAYLKGVPYCSDEVLAGISGAEETGRPELANPACPAASQVGTVQAGAGAGPYPFYAPGRVYLAGPYKGAPLSIVIVTPAVAGPFDLGNVVVRNALYVDPVTAQVTVKSDPIPTILHGLLLDVRDILVNIDRPGFTAAPTNCEPMSIGVRVGGEGGASTSVSNRFQVGGCEKLAFKPKLALRLFGGTRRSSHPRLVAKLTARPGDANIAGASVALPHSEFLDQAHIRTICTRVQFAAQRCPKGAIYGHAEARTPLLDSPVSGPVYLRSSSNPLPDLVAALRGPDRQPIEVVLSGRIDSVHGGIRSSFEAVPDQPVSSFVLNMQGGKKGLLVNSRNICNSVNRATANFTAQNGRTATLRPKLTNSCKKNKGKKHGRHGKRRSAR